MLICTQAPVLSAGSTTCSVADDVLTRYLIHAPYFAKSQSDLQEAWASMEKVKESGKARSIGVSNFLLDDIEDIMNGAKIPPSVNQIEFHPYLQHLGLATWLKQLNILTVSYGPLTPITRAPGGPLDELLSTLGRKYSATADQVLLRWVIDLGYVPVTTSGKESRLASYLHAFKFQLTPEEVGQISELGRKKHFRAFWKEKFAPDDRA